jgi:hypothetical protein
MARERKKNSFQSFSRRGSIFWVSELGQALLSNQHCVLKSLYLLFPFAVRLVDLASNFRPQKSRAEKNLRKATKERWEM